MARLCLPRRARYSTIPVSTSFLPLHSLAASDVADFLENTANYENPDEFDGFRFARERAEHAATHDPTQDVFKRQMISTAADHLPFGMGKHACPVRMCLTSWCLALMASFCFFRVFFIIAPGSVFRGDGAEGDACPSGHQL